MRIGFIIYGSLDTLTGGYLYDKIVIEGLVARGHQVEVISLTTGSYLMRLINSYTTAKRFSRAAQRFDIVIADELCHPSLLLLKSWLGKQAQKPPLVALVHHLSCLEPRPSWQRLLVGLVERRFLASVDGFIHNSATTRDSVGSQVQHNLPQVIASPAADRFGNLPSLDTIARRAYRPGPLKLLFLGMVAPRKGLLPLLSSLSSLNRDIWHLSIVGGHDFDAAYTARANKLIHQCDIIDSVDFLGPRTDDGLVEILNDNQIFCMPFAYEGFGIAILEAMAFGLPAIGSTRGAAGEIITHGKNGYLLDSDDQSGLGPLLAELHQDRKRLEDMARVARETYLSRPRWQESITTIETFLSELVDCRRQRTTAVPVESVSASGRHDSHAR